MRRSGQFGGWGHGASFGKYALRNVKEVQEKEGEEPVGIGRVGRSILAEEQFDAIKKDEFMEQVEKDLGSGAVDTLSKMETMQAQELLTKLEERLAGYPEETRKIAVWSLMWMAEKRKDEMREEEEKERAEQREKRVEEESERRESQNKNSETASENLMDDRSRKWENRRRLEGKEMKSLRC